MGERIVVTFDEKRSINDPGSLVYVLATEPPFSLKKIHQISFHGLPCACCDGNIRRIRAPTRMISTCIFQDGKRKVCFCPNCDAMVCDRCSNTISHNPVTQQAQCKWCTGNLHPINRQFLTYEQQRDPSFQLYSKAQKNITGVSRDWMNAMYKSHRRDYLSKNFWTPLMETIGWRFFVGLDFLVEEQHKRQFKLLMSNMAMRKIHKLHQRRLRNSSYANFKKMPEPKQVLYKQCRTNAINHGFSTVLILRLTKYFSHPNCFSTLNAYVSGGNAKKLAVGLGICKINPRKQKL